jgi:hypothetical protein
MTNIFNNHFINSVPIPTSHHSTSNHTHHILEHKFKLSFISNTDVLCLIKNLPNTLTQVMDQVPCKILKQASQYISSPLAYIINSSFSLGTFPDALKMSKVVLLHKKGCKEDVSNYRPLSLPSIFSKIFENAYLSQFSKFLISHNLISKSQHTFIKGRSTTTATFDLLSEIYSKLDLKKQETLGLFYDLSKAFDSIDHSILCHKLQSLGITGSELAWIRSYLTNRTQRVEIVSIENNGLKVKTYSDIIKVAQGSSFGPVLFNCYINDLPTILIIGLLINYADD